MSAGPSHAGPSEPHPSLLASLPPPPATAPAEPALPDPRTFADLISTLSYAGWPAAPPDWIKRLESYPFERDAGRRAGEVARAECQAEERLLSDEAWLSEGMQGKEAVLLHIIARQLTLQDAPARRDMLLNALARLSTGAGPEVFAQYHGKATQIVSTFMQLGNEPASQQPIASVACAVLSKLSRFGKVLTPLHPLVVEYCLRTDSIESASMVLDTHTFREIHPSTTYLDSLRYHYLGGLVKVATREWTAAHDLFHMAVCAPGTTASAVQVAAYKKFILIHVMLTGESYGLPRLTSQPMQRAIPSHCKKYMDLVGRLSELSDEEVSEIVQKNGDVWRADGNLGLLALVLATVPERKLLKLRDVYSKIGLQDVASRIAPAGQAPMSEEAVGQLVSRMIAEGKLSGTITPANESTPAFLSFTESSETYTDEAMLHKLVALAAAAEQEGAVFAEHDQKLTKNPKWIRQGVRQEKEKEAFDVPLGGDVPGARATGMRVGADWTDAGF